MAVDPLNPALPTLSTQVEVAAELRGIKGVVVTNKNNIEALQTLLANVTELTSYMGGLLALATSNLALDYLSLTETGIEVVRMETMEDLAEALGVTDYSPVINVAGVKTCIRFGDLKINLIYGSFADNTAHTWHTNFTSAIFGIVTAKNQNNNGSVQSYDISLSGCTVSMDGSGTRAYTVIAIGV